LSGGRLSGHLIIQLLAVFTPLFESINQPNVIL